MHCKQIVLNTLDDVNDFINATERCEFPITLKRPGDISVYNGKSFLSAVILAGWNLEVYYSGKNDRLEKILMKYRVTSMNTGWRDYVFHQNIEEAFMTGEPVIDSQHIRLVRFFNYLADACERDKHIQARRIFFGLEEHATIHFKTEEELAEKYGYPDQEAHQCDHGVLSEAVDFVEQMLFKPETELPELAEYVYKEFFPQFFEHIKNFDLDLCKYLAEQKQN